jgi:Skp family chaperone for outer membrane proteins
MKCYTEFSKRVGRDIKVQLENITNQQLISILDDIQDYKINLKSIFCIGNNNNISLIPKRFYYLFKNCEEFKFSNTNLTKIPDLPNCKKAIINGCKLTDLPSLPRCSYLDCSQNKIQLLPDLPNCDYLSCSQNQLKKLPFLPTCKNLYCENNQLQELPDLTNCKTLFCENNQLQQLPNLPNCKDLNCSNNQLQELPDLSKCEELYCSNNQLQELPDLPNCKEILICSYNQLQKLPDLSKCDILICSNNQLQELPDLPKCSKLVCNHNKLKYLPDLPKCEELKCSNNLLKTLPYIPKCNYLECNNNEFMQFGHINDVIDTISVKGNRKYVLNCNKIQELNPTLNILLCDISAKNLTLFSPKSPPKDKITRIVPQNYNYYMEQKLIKPKLLDVSLQSNNKEIDINPSVLTLQSMLRSQQQKSEFKETSSRRLKKVKKMMKELLKEYHEDDDDQVAEILLQLVFDNKLTVNEIVLAAKQMSEKYLTRIDEIIHYIRKRIGEFKQYEENQRLSPFTRVQTPLQRRITPSK